VAERALTLRRAVAAGASLALAVAACSPGGGERGREVPAAAATASEAPDRSAFVASTTCAECHREEWDAWVGSHHDRAMEEATEATVLGDFDDAEYASAEDPGTRARFFRRDGTYFVATLGPDGVERDYPVRYTFGVEPLQQYLVELDGGRLQAFDLAWDTERERWFDVFPDTDEPPGSPFHWSGVYLRWNAMCAECHSTDVHKRYDPSTETYATSWHEIDVGCQACHGPGAEHVRRAREGHVDGGGSAADAGLAVELRRGAAEAQLDACARCHARRQRLTDAYEHGRPFLDQFRPSRLDAGLYHADGQILDEVYVYGSFVQSRMYGAGVACTDCHDAHGLGLHLEGDALCAQCHTVNAPLERFPTLQKKRYDTPEHHFHPVESEGARCVACHMPAREYMVVDPRRDHGFRIPRPDLSASIGTPNACTGCHADRSAEWAAERVDEWYGPGTRERPGFAEAFAGGRTGDPAAATALAGLATGDQVAAIVRATALELLRPYGNAGLSAMLACLEDDDPLVRASAASGLDALPAPVRLELVAPLLADPVRSVRLAAVQALADVPRETFGADRGAAFDAALEEFRAAQEASADLPAAHMSLGIVHADAGDDERAARDYRRALKLDPGFLPARFNLAELLNSMGRNGEALDVLQRGLELAPEEGELHYSMGLLLSEEGHDEAAARELARAAELMPSRSRVRYNAALAQQRLGRLAEAEEGLLAAHRLQERDPDVVHRLVLLYLELEDPLRARVFAEMLADLVPDAPGPRELLRRIEDELRDDGR